MSRLVMALVAAALLAPTASAQAPSLDLLLQRMAAHVAVFKAQFSLVIGAEHYDQVLRDMNRRTRTRQLVSDVFFFRPGVDGPAMTVRSVQRVDGRSMKAAASRIDDALALPAERRFEKLKALADAGALYNLGSLQRNFNEPTLALTFAGADFQPRFTFQLEGADEVDGSELRRVSFSEVGRPTLIKDGRSGTDLPASGRIWADDNGVVRQTELQVDNRDTLATIRVMFRRDARLDIMVPTTMNEDYRYRDEDNERFMFISGHATYSGYRRFETSVRIVTP